MSLVVTSSAGRNFEQAYTNCLYDRHDSMPYSRERLTFYALLVLTAACIALSILLAGPFIPGLTWALAFAVVAHPFYRWLSSRVNKPDIAAGIAVAAVVIVIVGPTALLGWQIGRQTSERVSALQQMLGSDDWEKTLEQRPRLGRVYRLIAANVAIQHQLRMAGEALQQRIATWLQTAVYGIVQLLIALFTLFYFFRDRDQVLDTVRAFLPLSRHESDQFFERIRAMTHATIYGTVVVAGVQGTLGGLMFALLGIPPALLWGVAMGVLAIVPVLGAFVIWLPAALVLALQGSWVKAVILTVWGTVVIGLIDNLLYPILVGKEMRLHTLPVFIAIVGGLVLFGAAGIVLGPVILAATIAILEVLKRRTAQGRSAEHRT